MTSRGIYDRQNPTSGSVVRRAFVLQEHEQADGAVFSGRSKTEKAHKEKSDHS